MIGNHAPRYVRRIWCFAIVWGTIGQTVGSGLGTCLIRSEVGRLWETKQDVRFTARRPTMADTSHIEWTDATWNPVTGCTKISPGCKHCYAERLAHRLQLMGQANYRNGFRLT